jgi:acetyltransferase-like isoleucine patch superfamily enzyme
MVAFLARISGLINKFFQFKPESPEVNKQKFYTKDFFIDSSYVIGEYTYGKPEVLHWGEDANLQIGKFCSIADHVTIFLGGNHRTDWITTYPFTILNNKFPNAINITGHPSTKGDVIVENDVWIGYGASIMSGVRVGNGAVIGAFSVVTKDVEPYTIVAGNPAKMIRKRFSEDHIRFLLKIKWWDWPVDLINKKMNCLCNSDIDSFIQQDFDINILP